jgi:hypothetical protein
MHTFDDDVASVKRLAPEVHHEGVTPESAARSAGNAPDANALLHLQRTAGNAGVAQLVQSDDDPHGLQRLVHGGGGSPLPVDTRENMEGAFGEDFSSVRVHTGGEADQSAKSLGAHAYTAGNDVVFAEGHYDPGSSGGQRTLAHELTHVVQQRSGPVDGADNGSGVRVSDPGDRFEQAAEATADRVMTGQSDHDAGGGGGAPASVQREESDGADVQELADPAASVQRAEAGAEEAEEEPAVQGLFVQREGEEEEDAG